LAFVWEEHSLILGFVCAHDLGFRAYLSELIVDNSVRSQGIATRLIRAVEQVLTGRGQQVLIADVLARSSTFLQIARMGAAKCHTFETAIEGTALNFTNPIEFLASG
jgi:GNAT superfamily N-acetyltransferase